MDQKLIIVLTIIGLSFCSTVFASYETTKAIQYYENHEYERAKSILSTVDAINDPVASYMMGAIALQDERTKQVNKLETAIYWFEISSRLNNPQAHRALGISYEQRWLNNRQYNDFLKSQESYSLAIFKGVELASLDLDRLNSNHEAYYKEKPKAKLQPIKQAALIINDQPILATTSVKQPVAEKNDQTVIRLPTKKLQKRDNNENLSTNNTLNDTKYFTKMRPYIGMSVNIFSIISSELNASDPSINFNVSSSEKTRDSGTASGISGGIFINDNSKINFSFFSGKEKDSSFLTATVTSLSYDYSFNGSGVHRGWFLGGGFSSVEIEAEETNLTTAGTAKKTGAMLRGGYEYLFNNNLFLEVGFNIHSAETDSKINGKGLTSNLVFTTKMNVSNSYVTLSYAF